MKLLRKSKTDYFSKVKTKLAWIIKTFCKNVNRVSQSNEIFLTK